MIGQLILIMADVISEEEILDDIIKHAQQRKMSNNEESLVKLSMSCALFLSKHKTKKDGLEQTLKKFESYEKGSKIFDVDDKNN